MALSGVERIDDYVTALQEKPEEQQALYEDFLIRVTSFFRDPAAFEVLKSVVFPNLLQHRSPDSPIRIWVAGCSTGEEVYSLAITLLEVLGDMVSNTPVKILATDINETALDRARAGSYIDNIALDVSSDRLRRFFNKTNSHYQICKSVRDLCVFSTHNLTRDTPFANLDLISCRNLLIYLDLPLQKRIVPYFHYALKPGGCLMLGTSESISSSADAFEVIDKECRIYAKKAKITRIPIEFPISDRTIAPSLGWTASTEELSTAVDVQKETDRVLLNRFAPAAIVVDEKLSVLHFRGNAAPYIHPSPGPASLDLLRLVRQGLVVELQAAIDAAKRERSPVRREGLHFQDNGQPRSVTIEVLPIPPAGQEPRAFLIVFEEAESDGSEPRATEPAAASPGDATSATTARVLHLERQLAATQEYMQSVVEENEATNEELKAANEEILSSNEELQSTNEELQTAKEELQSTNEELTTVNEELKHRNRELNQLNDDLLNLFGGLNIPIIMVSRDLRIRRFTPAAEALFNLIPTDVGRRISDLRTNIDIPDLTNWIGSVIDSVTARERDVKDHAGRWYSLRIRPYITTENKIDGAALALVDITELKRTAEDLTASRDNAETIVETVWEPLVVLDQDLRVQRANAAFFRIFRLKASVVEGRPFAELEGRPWNQPDLIEKLKRVIPENLRIRDCEVEAEFPQVGRRTVLLNAHRIFWEGSATQMILLAVEDITNRKQDLEHAKALASEQAARAEAEAQNRSKDEFLAMLAHELRNPLAPIRNSFYILQQRFAGDPLVDQALAMSDRQISHMARLLDDLLDIARITQGKIQLRKELLHLQTAVSSAVESSRPFIDSRGHQLDVALPSEPVYLAADAARLEQILCNLLNNAAKYTDVGGQIRLEATRSNGSIEVRVSDNGVGIAPEMLPRVFELFIQASRSIDRSQGGLGIGLTLVKNLVSLHGGTVEAHSEGEGKGSTFTVRLPSVPSTARSQAVAANRGVDHTTTPQRILVVDDNRDAALTLAMLLRASGHTVTTALTADDALSAAAAERPEVVLLDIGLPKMSGLELARRLRQELQLTEAKIIAITGYGQEDDRHKSFEAGCDAHLVKPVNPHELEAALAAERPSATQ